MNLDFSMLRLIENGTTVNTTITTKYTLLTIPIKSFEDVLINIEKDFTEIITKYLKNYKLKIKD